MSEASKTVISIVTVFAFCLLAGFVVFTLVRMTPAEQPKQGTQTYTDFEYAYAICEHGWHMFYTAQERYSAREAAEKAERDCDESVELYGSEEHFTELYLSEVGR